MRNGIIGWNTTFLMPCFMASCLAYTAIPDTFDPACATFEELVVHSQKYGSTPLKRAMRKVSIQELFKRGTESLHYLMKNAHLKNDSIFMFSDRLVRKQLSGKEAATVLLDYISAKETKTRKQAAYLLGFCETPHHWIRILPLLDDEATAGAAMRTLGKWKIKSAADRITPFLYHEKEILRILAVNALRDIGDSSYSKDLISTLNDPVFSVRKASSRALSEIKGDTEKMLLDEFPGSRGFAKREIINILGRLKSKSSIKYLRAMLDDPLLKQDATDALMQFHQN